LFTLNQVFEPNLKTDFNFEPRLTTQQVLKLSLPTHKT
jgi:hypothetical protein